MFLLTACTPLSKNYHRTIEGNEESSKLILIGGGSFSNIYKLTYDSCEYIIYDCGNGAAIVKHKDLHKQ